MINLPNIQIDSKQLKVLEQSRDKMHDALREIKEITRGLGEFNPTYEKIHKIASEALGVSENDG